MSTVTITCPQCGFSQHFPVENVPNAPLLRALCPRCKHSFKFEKTGGPEVTMNGSLVSPPIDASIPASAASLPSQWQSNGVMTPIGASFVEAWGIYRRRFWTLFSLYLLSSLFLLLTIGIFVLAGWFLAKTIPAISQEILVISGGVGGVIGFLGASLGYAGFLAALLDDRMGIRESLECGKDKLWSFLWVSFLIGFIVSGWFLFVLIPGIIFHTWFFFAQFIVMEGNTRGMSALLQSKQYVRGHWFGVFLRLLGILVFFLVIGLIPFIGSILSLLVFPYTMVFCSLIYRDLKSLKADDSMPLYTTWDKAQWLIMGGIPWIILLVILVVAII
jgi:hypothetical protein